MTDISKRPECYTEGILLEGAVSSADFLQCDTNVRVSNAAADEGFDLESVWN